MKKILTILLALAISTSAFGINIKIINDTTASGGWKAKIASRGQFITKYRYMRRKRKIANFSNIPSNCTVQIVSNRNIGKGTAISSSKITLRKDINSNQNVIINIKECKASTRQCQNMVAGKEESEEEAGKKNKHYYVD